MKLNIGLCQNKHFLKLMVTVTMKEEAAVTTTMVTSVTVLVTAIMEGDISVVLVALVEPPAETWTVAVSIHSRFHSKPLPF